MTVLSQLLDANNDYATTFTKGDLPMPPGRRFTVVTCMDARIDPARLLGLEEGDAHVIRNAGGRVSGDVIRSLAISQQLLGTEHVFVIHHTDCGMTTFSNDDLRGLLKERLDSDASGIDFLPFTDLAQSVRDDVAAVQASPLIPDDIPVHGLIYDVRSGTLQPVE